jgi:hypothetical protein
MLPACLKLAIGQRKWYCELGFVALVEEVLGKKIQTSGNTESRNRPLNFQTASDKAAVM